MALSPLQAAHVAKVFPEARADMTDYLERGVSVCIGPQRDCGPDVPPIAIWVVEAPAFWIDCCRTVAEAINLAESLGLSVERKAKRKESRA